MSRAGNGRGEFRAPEFADFPITCHESRSAAVERLAGETFRLAVEACPIGMLMLDGDGRIVMVNAEIERQFGYDREQLIGQAAEMLIPMRLRAEYLRHRELFRRRPEAHRIAAGQQFFGLRQNGIEFSVEIGLTPVEVEHDPLLLAVIVDASQRNEAEQQLAQLEGRYRGLLEAAPDAIVVVNQSGDIVLLNVQAEQQFGYHRDELLGQQVKNIIPQGFAERLIADKLRTAEDARTQQIGTGIELIARRKDGSEFPIEIMLSPLDSPEGVLVTAAIRDISERKDAEKHLVQMEGKYQALLEAAPDAMVVVNQSGEIVLLNLQAEKQFAYRRDELLGQKVTNIIPEGFAERLIADRLRSREDALAQHIGAGIELTGRRKDGSEFPIEIMLSPLETEGSILVTAAIREISARKHMERLRDEFVATVSHELRTPLTSISGSLGLLVGQWVGIFPEPAARLVAIAYKNSQRLVRLINDILDIEKLGDGRVVFNLCRIDVRVIVEQAIESNRGFAEGYGVHVGLTTASGSGDVNADPDRLAQVITNLLSNAIKASPPGRDVLVAVDRHDDFVRISVRDQGSGIPAAFRLHIFEKFAQADATDARQKGGTGLGLSIVKQIVERLNGRVSFEDAAGGGTVFCVDLPAWKRPVDEPPVPKYRILHLDDDPDILAVVAHALSSAAQIVSVESLQDARRILSVDPVDMVLLDISVGEHSGLELMPDLRDADGTAIPVIIFCTSPVELAPDRQVHKTLVKSRTPLDLLLASVRDCLADREHREDA
ncbi:PAS domain S-box protein [Rhodopseudomonas palustris]|uniref:PAS domain S-box protein n=1 Tax=Rhodopseudomonas palustris TaxID=1076 RepID=UPI002ACF001B|nr:PAS domain S-box protein [Rhodopseudomonas palustris]WQG99802.1 PAS domain S-box protein [Rhodopseudomonas palustris]